MRKTVVALCLGLLALNAYSQGILEGARGAGKVGGTAPTKVDAPKTPAKTSTTVKKTPVYSPTDKQDPNEKFAASGYMEITGMSFANTDSLGTIIDDYGSNLYASEVKYLKPKIFYRGLASEEKEIKVDVKIIHEDGYTKLGADSPDGYTFSCELDIEPGSGKYVTLSGWGTNLGGSYSSGQYTYEIWHNGNIIYQKGIRLYSGCTPLVTSKIMEIKRVYFANQDSAGDVTTNYGNTLYEGDIQYVKPMIQYSGLYENDQTVTLYYKFFRPSGCMIVGSSSPLCYSSKQDVIVHPGLNKLYLNGWGSVSTSTYTEGEYKVEYWLDGEKIYQTTFSVKKRGAESEDNNSSALLKSLLIYPMGDNTLTGFDDASSEVIKNDLSEEYDVDDQSEDEESKYWIRPQSSYDMPNMNYLNMPFHYFYYYSNGNTLNQRFVYCWEFEKRTDCYALLDQIIEDFQSIGIDLSYEKKNDEFQKAYGEVSVGNKKYSIELSDYSVYQLEISCSF